MTKIPVRKTMTVQELGKMIHQLARRWGYDAVEPSERLLKVHRNDKGPSFIDFSVYKGGRYRGHISVLIRNALVSKQTVEVVELINKTD